MRKAVTKPALKFHHSPFTTSSEPEATELRAKKELTFFTKKVGV
jgi:hypothetical protein